MKHLIEFNFGLLDIVWDTPIYPEIFFSWLLTRLPWIYKLTDTDIDSVRYE